MKLIKQAISLVLAIVLCGQVIVQAVGDGNIDGGGGGNLGGGNGNSSWSEVSAFDGSRREGVRVTVIDTRTNTRAAGTSTIDYTNTNTIDNATGCPLQQAIHFGKKSKIDYKNNPTLSFGQANNTSHAYKNVQQMFTYFMTNYLQA